VFGLICGKGKVLADRKITELANITGANLADADEFVVVDASADETKAITFAELKSGLDTATGFVRITGDTMTGNLDIQGTLTSDGLVSAGTAFVNLTARPAGVPATAGALWSAQTETGNYGIVSRASSTDSFTYIGNTGSSATLGTSYGSSGSYLPLDLQTSDKKRLRIDSNGDISFYEDTGTTAKFFWDASAEALGIGTSSPSAELEIAASSAQIRLTDTDTNAYAEIGTDGSGILNFMADEGNTGTSPRITFDISTTERMRIDSSGNVGIGTSSPSDKLTLDSGQMRLSDNYGIRWGTASTAIYGSAGAGTLQMYTNSSERMRIDSSGKVLVGFDNIAYANGDLVVGKGTASGDSTLGIQSNGSANLNKINFGDGGRGDRASIISGATNYLAFSTFDGSSTTTERMRIDSSGNLLVGKTDTTFSTAGFVLSNQFDVFQATRDQGNPVELNRTTSDGDIIKLYKDGSAVGSIGVNSGYLYVGGTEGNDAFLSFGADGVRPSTSAGAARDAAIDLGGSTNRFKDLYLSGGVVASASSGNSAHTFTATANNTRATLATSAKTSGGVEVQGVLGSYGDASKVDIGTLSNHATAFITNNTEVGRFDTSGNLLVGKTAIDNTTDGFYANVDGFGAVNTGARCATFVRNTSDGDIVEFRKDTTTVGSIGTQGGDLWIGTNDTGLYFQDGADAIIPWNTSTNTTRDDAIDLGSSSYRFDDIYATNGTIQTSDANEKQDIDVLSDAEQRVAQACKGLLRKFRWRDAVEEKGDEARTHFGIIAQDLQAAFAAEGLDAGDYAMFIHTTWTDEETGEERSRMGVRYSELLAFIIAAI
jgi:hypothetical protein